MNNQLRGEKKKHSPQISYCGFRAPITPATTGPTLIPFRRVNINNEEIRAFHEIHTELLELTDSHTKIVERVFINFFDFGKQLHRIIGHGGDMTKID